MFRTIFLVNFRRIVCTFVATRGYPLKIYRRKEPGRQLLETCAYAGYHWCVHPIPYKTCFTCLLILASKHDSGKVARCVPWLR